MDAQHALLSLELPELWDEAFIPQAKLKAGVAASVLTTTTKMQENFFRARQTDHLARLLAEMKSGQPVDFLAGVADE